jgi:hypothetical protein
MKNYSKANAGKLTGFYQEFEDDFLFCSGKKNMSLAVVIIF